MTPEVCQSCGVDVPADEPVVVHQGSTVGRDAEPTRLCAICGASDLLRRWSVSEAASSRAGEVSLLREVSLMLRAAAEIARR